MSGLRLGGLRYEFQADHAEEQVTFSVGKE